VYPKVVIPFVDFCCVYASTRARALLIFYDCLSSYSFRFTIIVQNPGRVVTLVHQEDWDAFSGAVSQ
jgi:hypothetical protein